MECKRTSKWSDRQIFLMVSALKSATTDMEAMERLARGLTEQLAKQRASLSDFLDEITRLTT